MKTAQDILDYYKVEVGKTYIITNQRKSIKYENFVGRSFNVNIDSRREYPFINYDNYELNIHMLEDFDYEEIKKPKTYAEVKYGDIGCDKCPFRNLECKLSSMSGENTLQEILDELKLDDEEREFYQKRINKEYKEK